MKKALSIADSLKVNGVDGIAVLPLFVSETASDFYFRGKPEARRETIIRTKTKGIGFEDGTLISQLTGSTFVQYNFIKIT